MPDSRPPHFSMLRAFTLADLFTFGNAASGVGAIFCCLDYLMTDRRAVLWLAFALLPLSLVFDALDGRIARWRHTHSALGGELDSLADTVSFGVAPAVLAFTLGLRDMLDILCLVFFVSCGISRLARYNVTSAAMADERGKVHYFQGTPVTVSLLLVVAAAVAFATGHVGDAIWFGTLPVGPVHLHPVALVFPLVGCAMVSGTLRIPKP
jgi:CDP-diacylglycerol---serine O-phosphatidyltransferase